jgi:hypothetical protein
VENPDRRHESGCTSYYRAGRLPEVYAGMVADEATIERRVSEGKLVIDTSFRDLLARCPDPLARNGPKRSSASGPITVTLDDETRESEMAAVAEDMMLALVRPQHAIADRVMAQLEAREKIKSLRAANRKLEREGRDLARDVADLRRARHASR